MKQESGMDIPDDETLTGALDADHYNDMTSETLTESTPLIKTPREEQLKLSKQSLDENCEKFMILNGIFICLTIIFAVCSILAQFFEFYGYIVTGLVLTGLVLGIILGILIRKHVCDDDDDEFKSQRLFTFFCVYTIVCVVTIVALFVTDVVYTILFPSKFERYYKDEYGKSAAEYMVVLAIIIAILFGLMWIVLMLFYMNILTIMIKGMYSICFTLAVENVDIDQEAKEAKEASKILQYAFSFSLKYQFGISKLCMEPCVKSIAWIKKDFNLAKVCTILFFTCSVLTLLFLLFPTVSSLTMICLFYFWCCNTKVAEKLRDISKSCFTCLGIICFCSLWFFLSWLLFYLVCEITTIDGVDSLCQIWNAAVENIWTIL